MTLTTESGHISSNYLMSKYSHQHLMVARLIFASLIKTREQFDGHKRLPKGLHPQTVQKAHNFKAASKEVFHMASVR